MFAEDGVCGGCAARGVMTGAIRRDHPMLAALAAWGATNRPASALSPRAPAVPRKPPPQLALFGDEALTYRPAPGAPALAPRPLPAFATEAAVVTAPPQPGPLPRGRFRADAYTPATAHLCAACTRSVVAALSHHGQPLPPGYAWAVAAP